jgi:hypothetical protein
MTAITYPIYCAADGCGAGLGFVELPFGVDPDLATSGHLCSPHGEAYVEQLAAGDITAGELPAP